MESQWLTYAKRLQAIASTGLYFSKDQFDRERYQEIADIANGMLAELPGRREYRNIKFTSSRSFTRMCASRYSSTRPTASGMKLRASPRRLAKIQNEARKLAVVRGETAAA